MGSPPWKAWKGASLPPSSLGDFLNSFYTPSTVLGARDRQRTTELVPALTESHSGKETDLPAVITQTSVITNCIKVPNVQKRKKEKIESRHLDNDFN